MPPSSGRFPLCCLRSCPGTPSPSNLRFAVGCQGFGVRCTNTDPGEVPQTHALEFGDPTANFGFGVLESVQPGLLVLAQFLNEDRHLLHQRQRIGHVAKPFGAPPARVARRHKFRA